MELDLNNLVENGQYGLGSNDIVVKNRLPYSRVGINYVSHGDDHLLRMIKREFVLPSALQKYMYLQSSLCRGV